jgi:hypothetical protein
MSTRTCRQHVGPPAKCRQFWPTRPCRADTKLIPTQYFRVGDGWHLSLFLLVPEVRTYYIRTTCQKPQHTTTNMSHTALPSTGFRPLPPWVGQCHYQIMVPPLPIIGLVGAAVGSLVWGANASPIKKERGRQGLGLRWSLLSGKT